MHLSYLSEVAFLFLESNIGSNMAAAFLSHRSPTAFRSITFYLQGAHSRQKIAYHHPFHRLLRHFNISEKARVRAKFFMT